MKEVIMFNKITKEEKEKKFKIVKKKEEEFKIVKEKVNENVTIIRFIPNTNKEYWWLIKKN